jgi:hypothetical protein
VVRGLGALKVLRLRGTASRATAVVGTRRLE